MQILHGDTDMCMATPTEPPDLMSRPEAARFLGVSTAHLAVDVVTHRHSFPFYRIGRRCLYSRRALTAYLAAHEVNSLGDAQNTSDVGSKTGRHCSPN